MTKFEKIVSNIRNKDIQLLKNNIHPDFILIRDSSLVSKDELVGYLEQMFNGGIIRLDFNCHY